MEMRKIGEKISFLINKNKFTLERLKLILEKNGSLVSQYFKEELKNNKVLSFKI